MYNKKLPYIFFSLGLIFSISYSYAINSLSAYTNQANRQSILDREINKLIKHERIKYQLPALSMSLLLPDEKNPKNYVSGYYADLSERLITSDTLFQIGSITKSFIATIVLQLAEKNKLTLNDKLKQWLPQYQRWSSITIKDLLRHTSGVYDYSHGKNFDAMLRKTPYKIWTSQELIEIAYVQNDIFKPGRGYHYSNTDYVLLGLIIEKATHQPIQQILTEYAQKYHLNDTFYTAKGYPSELMNRIVHGYNRDGTFKFNQDVTYVSQSFGQMAGAMISRPNDIINWLYQLMNGNIISNQSLDEMKHIVSTKNGKTIKMVTAEQAKKLQKSFIEIGAGAGIGLVYFEKHGFTWVHAGGTLGYEAFYTYNPCTGIYVVLMYDVKPQQQFIFAKIAANLFNILSDSSAINKSIKQYQHSHTLPRYCTK